MHWLICVFAAAESRVKIWSVKLMTAPGGSGCCPFWGGGSAVVYSLLLLPLFGGEGVVLGLCFFCSTLCPFQFCDHPAGEERAFVVL